MSNKLNNMKNEYDEIMKKYEEGRLHCQKITDEWSVIIAPYNTKGLGLPEKLLKEYQDAVNNSNKELSKLSDKAQELRDKIRIREEALDLLIELGLVNENLKQPSIFDKIKSLI